MHSFGLVLVPAKTNDICATIEELFAPYYLELEVEPWKEFFSSQDTAHLISHHNARDVNDLVEILSAKGSKGIGAQNGLFYWMVTRNPRGRWDYYLFGGCYNRKIYRQSAAELGREKGWSEAVCANICVVGELDSEVMPSTIITPQGDWHDCEDFGWRMVNEASDNQKPWAIWKIHVRRLLQQHAECLAVGLDIHS